MNKRRSYRALQRDGAAEVAAALDRVDGPHECPACGHRWTGSSAPTAPPEIADRSPVDRDTRRAKLAPTSRRLAAALRDATPEITFTVWLAPLVVEDFIGDVVYLSAPHEIASWAAERYASFIAGAASSLAGRPIAVRIYASAPTSAETPNLGALAGILPEGERAPAAARRPAAGARDDDSHDAGTETAS